MGGGLRGGEVTKRVTNSLSTIMIHLGWILIITAGNLMAPILWIGLFNFIGLKRILERLGDLEADSDALRNKTRSLQSQVGKYKQPAQPIDEDEKISAEINAYMRNSDDKISNLTINRGGIRNADPDRVSESS